MAFEPASPFPKVPGNEIRAQDWNDLVVEVQRLGQELAAAMGSGVAARLDSMEAQLADIERRLEILEDRTAPDPTE